jgi:hypothetical protein
MLHEDKVELHFILHLTTVLLEVVVACAFRTKAFGACQHDQEGRYGSVGVVVEHFDAAHEQVLILLGKAERSMR